MKILYKILVVFIFITINIYPQFSHQNSGTTQELESVYFINQDIGFAAGWYIILKTNDGGITWTQKFNSSSVIFQFLKFFSSTEGLAVANNGIFKTTDGGEYWSQYSSNMPVNGASASYFISPKLGWCTSGRSIYKTTDGGLTWASQVTSSNYLYSIFMLDENEGWGGGNYGAFYRTTDGGANWIYDALPNSLLYNKVYFINSNLGWLISSDGYLYQSNDGGNNWILQTIPHSPTDIIFNSTLEGWACGYTNTSTAKIWKTTNSGNIWIEVTIPSSYKLNAIWSSDPDNVWTVGYNGNILSNAKRIYLTSPIGGNTWQIGSNQMVTWKNFNLSNIKIELSTNDGADWTVLAASVPANSSSYNFTVPNTPSANCRIRISDVSNPGTNDVSDSKFTIQGILIQSPIGSEIWDVGTQHDISWFSAGVINLKIEYTTNNGSDWLVISPSVAAANGLYNWTIPEAPSNSCKVRLTSLENQSIISVSNDLFVIRGIKITSPNGGEEYFAGTTQTIEWVSDLIDSIKIEYSLNNGSSWILIDSSVVSTGSYNWVLPEITSSECKVKITDKLYDLIYDISDNVFSIDSTTSVEDLFNFIPKDFALYQNFPNPFNPTTRIYYSAPKESQVTIKLYDILGEEIKSLVDEIKSTGNYWIDLDGSQLHSGVYIYQMSADKFNQTKKMILLK